MRESCKACPRGGNPPRVIDVELETEVCDRIERLVLERGCGFPVKLEEVLAEEKELLLVWEDRERQHKFSLMTHTAEVGSYIKAFIDSFAKK